jgi:glycosyltransferase involved in cell wall biosynthesis
MSLRVAVLAATARPWHRHGGLERHVLQLCRWLRKRDVCVDLFTSPPEYAAEPFPADGGFRLSIVSGKPFWRSRFAVVLSRNTLYPLFSLRMGRRVLREARSRIYAAVIAQGLAGFGYALHAARRPGYPPLILNPQGMEESLTPSAAKRAAYLPFRAMTRYTARRAAVTIATDASFAAVVERVLGVSADRVEVIPNAIDVDECLCLADPERGRRLCERFGLAGSRPLIVTVGRLAPNKGFAVGLDALARVRGELPPSWRWVVVGEGPLAGDLANAARRLELGEHVRFIGGVSDADVHSLLALADLFLNPTLYEGSSLVTLEAMSHGCAVVATRAGGIPDKIEEAVTGWLAEPGDADSLAQAISRWRMAGDGARAHVGAAAAERCRQRFDWPRCADRYVEVIRALDGRSGGRVVTGPRAAAGIGAEPAGGWQAVEPPRGERR